ncbi:MAG: hypothetical protein PHT94_02630 [Candidatus Nanoarchaeia archaeon]|nr:hypothetical protein [Candidatus Nanoarchaeia archaeon]
MIFKQKKILLSLFLLFLVLIQNTISVGVTIEDSKIDNLGLVWNKVNIQYGGFLESDFDIYYSNIGYYIGETFFTKNSKLSGELIYFSNEPCVFQEGSIIQLKSYYEFFKTLQEGENKITFICGEKIVEKNIVYDPNLKYPVYNLTPIASSNTYNFKVRFNSRMPIDGNDCELKDNKGNYYTIITGTSIQIIGYSSIINFYAYTDEDLDFDDGELNLTLNCSKEGFSDYLKNWKIYFDINLKINELNFKDEKNNKIYDLLNETYLSPYTSNNITFSNKNIKLNVNINETGKLTFKNLYYDPSLQEINITKNGLEFNFSIGKYLLADTYVNDNNIEFEISDLATNTEGKKHYKIIYESTDVDIVTNDIDGTLYDDFILIIENKDNANLDTLKINNNAYSINNCIDIGNNKKCFVNTSSYTQEQINNFVIEIESLDSQIIKKNYTWIKNVHNFKYDIIENNFLSNKIPIFESNPDIRFIFDKKENSDYQIKIINNQNGNEDRIDFNSIFLNSISNKAVKSYSINSNNDMNYIRVQFLVNDSVKYEFDYLYYKKDSLNYSINEISYRGEKGSLYFKDPINDFYKKCGNNICEKEDCKDDCFKEIVNIAPSGSYSYSEIDKSHNYSVSLGSYSIKISININENKEYLNNVFLQKEFDAFKVIDNTVIFKKAGKEEFFYLSGNYLLEFTDNDENQIAKELLKRYESDSKLSYGVDLSNNYLYTINYTPNKFKYCGNVERIEIFNSFNITFCKKSENIIQQTAQTIANFNLLQGELNSAVILKNDDLIYTQYLDTNEFVTDYYVKNIN